MMNQYQYTTPDNRTVLSTKPLLYAMTSSHTIDINKITKEDLPCVSIIADKYLGAMMAALAPEVNAEWTNEYAFPASQSWFLHNYCISSDNTIQIRNGKKYISLNNFLETATIDELKYVLTQAATQAALCRTELLLATQSKLVAG